MVRRRALIALILASSFLFLTSTLVSAQEEGFSVVIDPDKGQVGEKVTVTVTGFEVGSKLTISFDDKVVMEDTVQTEIKFETSFEVPLAEAGGCHQIRIKGKILHRIAISFGVSSTMELFRRFVIKPILEVEEPKPALAFVGDTVMLKGSGFTGNVKAKLLFDDKQLEVMYDNEWESSWETDGVGSFIVLFTVPDTSPGEKIIQVLDAQAYMGQTSFIVTEQPLPPPPAEAPTITIPPVQQIAPNWIYAVIGVGATLAVVMIVLIVRTRKP